MKIAVDCHILKCMHSSNLSCCYTLLLSYLEAFAQDRSILYSLNIIADNDLLADVDVLVAALISN